MPTVSPDNRDKSSASLPLAVRLSCWLAAWLILFFATLLTNPGGLRYAFFFPIGWAAFLQTSDIQTALIGLTGWWILGWGCYLTLTIVLFLIRNRYLYFILFLIFCLLLGVNAIGCKKVLDTHPNLLR
jgi:hypothetical protein